MEMGNGTSRKVARFSSAMPVSLPDEILTEVLLRLPVKSIYRFRAVCRSWAADLSSDEFCTMHMAKADAAGAAASAPPRLLFVAPTMGYSSTALYSCSPSDPVADMLFTLDELRGNFVGPMAAQCRGLNLLYDAVLPAYYVLNAATRAVTRLPPCPEVSSSSAGLGFDSRTKEYKVVRLFMQSSYDRQLMKSSLQIKCEIYTLGGRYGDHWRPATGGVPSSFCHAAQAALANANLDKLPPVLANGSLHWLLLPLFQTTSPGLAIMSFSITEETFGWVQPPPFITSRGSHLVELDGHLCLARDLRAGSPTMLEIWKLQDSASGDWSLDYRIDLSGQTTRDILEPQVVRVLGVSGDDTSGKKIIIATSQHKVHAYDAMSGTLETILSTGDTFAGEVTSSSFLRVSLFTETLAPVHATNEEISLSSPAAKAVKEILLRLPAQSVVRFKTVCSQWRRLVEGESFMHPYFMHKKMDKGPKIMLVGKGSGRLPFLFSPLKKWLSEGSSSNQGACLETKVVCSKPCHGLNLVSTAEEDYLYNPCTGYYKITSYPGSLICTPWERPSDGPSIQDSAFSVGNRNIGLGFNSLIQEHISIIILYQHKDFRSREYRLTCSIWQCSSGYLHRISAPPLPVNDMPPTYVAGVFYWMSDPLLGPSNEQAVVAFDIASQEFDVIPSPSHIAKWCSNSGRHGFMAELQGMPCAVLADSMADELEIWKLDHDQWDRSCTICLKAWPDYSLLSNIVVPLSIDPNDGRILLSTGRKVGLYDPMDITLERLCEVDEMPHYISKNRDILSISEGSHPSKRPRLDCNIRQIRELTAGQHFLQAPYLNKCNNNISTEKLNGVSHSAVMPLVPMLYEESLMTYPRVLKMRILE